MTLSTMTPNLSLPEELGHGIQLNKGQRALTCGDQIIRLTQKEFDILFNLNVDPGRVYGRQELLKQVWGSTVHVAERTIDAHIVRLRRKMRAFGERAPSIDTVWALGYRLRN